METYRRFFADNAFYGTIAASFVPAKGQGPEELAVGQKSAVDPRGRE